MFDRIIIPNLFNFEKANAQFQETKLVTVMSGPEASGQRKTCHVAN